MPLVGIWIKGTLSIDHPMVLAACLRYTYSTTLPDKAFQGDNAFMMLLFPQGTTAHMFDKAGNGIDKNVGIH